MQLLSVHWTGDPVDDTSAASTTVDSQTVTEDIDSSTYSSSSSLFWTTASEDLATTRESISTGSLAGGSIAADSSTRESILTDILTWGSVAADSSTKESIITGGSIVTDSLTEQAILLSALVLFLVYVNLSNTFLLYAMKKTSLLDSPQYMILASYMVCDLLYFNLQLPVMIPVLIKNRMDAIQVLPCSVFMTTSAGFFLACIQLVGLISYERYSYFITPLKYPEKFTKLRVYTMVSVIVFFSLCASVFGTFMSPRIPVATTISCQATGENFLMSTLALIGFFCAPSGLMSIVTLIRLRLLMSKHQAQMAAAPEAINEDHSAVHGIIIRPIKKAFKMVILVSVCFWLTIMPGVAIRFGLTASGVTWSETDDRTSFALFALSRANYFLIFLVSSCINPIIYVASLPEIRKAVRKCLRVRQLNTD